MKLLKIFFATMFSLLFLVVSSTVVSAAKYYPTTSAPTPTPIVQVNSFDLFWPLVPGKVMGDSLYNFKLLKEKVRGWVIFGSPQKSDYFVFIATKRAIEAEQLLKDGKTDLASKTLDNFNDRINYAESLWQKAKSEGQVPSTNKDNINKQLSNLDTFLKYLSTKSGGDIKSKVDAGEAKVQEFLKSL